MSSDFLRQSLVGLKLLLVLTVVLGVIYPAAVWGAGRVTGPERADGQIVSVDGRDIGSRLLGQHFPVRDDGWFHGRPSANDYDGLASGASNLGPSNPDLLTAIEERRSVIARVEGVPSDEVPADAVTASGSGLDRYVSPAYAALQVERVARHRGLTDARVRELVARATDGRQLGFLGQAGVDVLELNVSLLRK